jgi:mannose-1-phosphate guanylyltransferase
MHAVILAGGRGARLRPYTTSLPKPLVPIGDEYSILEIVLTQLVAQGFTGATLAIGHLGHLIRSFVGDGSRWGIQMTYVEETSPLGTIGPVLQILDQLPDEVVVMNGDILTDLRYDQLLLHHISNDAPLTIATYERQVHIDFGVLEVEAARVTAFREKPSLCYRVSMGVYGISIEALRRYPVGQYLGFDDLVLDLLSRELPPAHFPFDGFWLDVGRPDDYDRANREFAGLRGILMPSLPTKREVTLPDPGLRIVINGADRPVPTVAGR